MKKVLAWLAALLLFAGCRQTQSPGPSESGPSASQASSMEPQQSGDAQTVQMLERDYIQLYEKYALGTPFSEDSSEGFPLDFLFGWLQQNGGMDRFAVYNGSMPEYYELPGQTVRELVDCFFGTEARKSLGGAAINYSSDADSFFGVRQPQVTLENSELLENGDYRLTVRREMDGRRWYPAEYVFRPVVLSEEPGAELAALYQKGDTIFRFVSVRNLELPEQPPEMVAIHTPQELMELSRLVNSGDWAYQNNVYQLAADIDLFGVTLDPIGGYDNRGDFRDPASTGFGATFDGQGHTIRNLTLKAESGPAGLFAAVGKEGMVSNLNLEHCDVSGPAGESGPVGGLVGVLRGTVNKCAVTGQISGRGSVGGLVGMADADSEIWNSRADTVVTGNNAVGGLIGTTSGSGVYSCTALGEVNAVPDGDSPPQEIGGFIGSNNYTAVDHGIVSVAVRTQAAANMVGSFIGYDYGDLTGCFYNTDLSANWKTIGASYRGASYTVDLIGLSQQELEEMGAI